jgi:hypothetical protein
VNSPDRLHVTVRSPDSDTVAIIEIRHAHRTQKAARDAEDTVTQHAEDLVRSVTGEKGALETIVRAWSSDEEPDAAG